MKKASTIIRESIESRWGPAGVTAVERLAAHIEAIEHVEEIEQTEEIEGVDDDWEGFLVAEARAIVAGTSEALPAVEHLQVLLRELDGARRARCATPIEALPF